VLYIKWSSNFASPPHRPQNYPRTLLKVPFCPPCPIDQLIHPNSNYDKPEQPTSLPIPRHRSNDGWNHSYKYHPYTYLSFSTKNPTPKKIQSAKNKNRKTYTQSPPPSEQLALAEKRRFTRISLSNWQQVAHGQHTWAESPWKLRSV